MGTTVCVFGLSDLSSPADLVRFLESFTGVQAIAQCKFQAGKKDGGRPWALVQFKSSDDAFSVIELARRGKLTFLGGRLTIFADKKQHQRKRDDSEVTITDVVVQAGCLVRNDLFYSLWQRPGCDIIAGLKKFCIIVHGNRNDYDTCKDLCKLEWRSSDIVEFSSWKEISGRLTFMLRAWNAPQIFRYSPSPDYYACEGFFGYLLSGLSDGVWVRTVDFSPEASIGQSYVYCLHVNQQFSGELDFLINTNPGFPVIQRNLSIRLGCHYSASLQTVPILASPYLQYIPFEIVFSVNSLVQTGYLSGPGLGHRFFGLLSPTLEKTKDHILHVLEKFKRLEDTCFEPEQWFEKESSEALRQPERRRLIERHLDDGLQYIRKVLVTPTRVYFRGPEVDFSNRVTRHFKEHIDNFIRVSFVEEDADVIPASVFVMHKAFGLQSENADMYNRIVSVLSDGITIGNKVFEFLAFSSSQLRDNSVWMFSATDTVTADGIRNWMGDFLGIRNVAKCAARMGQSFSSSTKSLDVPLSEIEEIPDISTESLTGRYCFSDGIGKISASFATKVAKQCKLKVVPSLYQIRYGGFKGVVAVHPTSIYKLSLRPSMKKFPSQQISLDILKHSQIVPSYLNREIITLLSTLGVKDTIFERMQEKVVEQLDTMLTDAVVALEVVQSFNRSVTNQIMEEMLLGGFHPISEPFLRRMLYTFRASQLMDLRKKARIFVPKGRLLMGCLDETRTLDYGEVFVCVSPIAETHSVVEDGLSYSRVKGINNIHRIAGVVKGKVIVAKNPCVHPGDIRVLTAVNVPALHHLIDCVVFPQKGCR
ncbi:hypothetical protein KP509_03G095200 [Ceratopteris richardii]|nr:hypothetical protein KP509_03G095200 [Ceratopteris richardii]